MKKIVIAIASLILVIITIFTIYWNLPIEVTRKSDIQLGNELIQKIESYNQVNKKFPENNDWETLVQLGFKKEYLGTKPDYKTDSKGAYELTYLDDFDGPYLIWNSNEKKWSIDFPKINNK